MASWVALIVAVVVPVSGEIDRTDQRATASDGLLRRTASGAGQRIYILDCGVATTLDTSPRVSLGYVAPLVGPGTNAHGTLMSSIAAGNARGLARTAAIIDVKICDNVRHDIGDFKLGLDWTLTQLPGIVNISNEWTLSAGNPDIASISSKISALRAAGFVVVVAAGNGIAGSGVPVNNGSSVVVPAASAAAVTVASFQYTTNQRWISSNYGPEVDLFAAATLDAVGTTGTVSDTGTSGSAALVSGAFAAAANYGPTYSGANLESFVTSGSIFNTIPNGNSPNASYLFSDLGTVSQSALSAPQPGIALFCGFGSSTTTTTSSASGPNGETYFSLETRCAGTNVPVIFSVEKRNAAGAVVFRVSIPDPNGSNSGAGESIRSLAVSPNGQQLAFAATTRESTRFSITNSYGFPGGLDAYLVLMNANTGVVSAAYRYGSSATDSARAVVYAGQSVFLGAVIEGSTGLPLMGSSDLAVLSLNLSSSVVGATSFPVAGEVRINAAAALGGQPVFVGASNVDPLGAAQAAFQAAGFQFSVNGSGHASGISTSYWMPQAGGDSEAHSAGVPVLASQSSNLFIASTRRVFPQPVAWHFVRLDRFINGNQNSQWQALWTSGSQWRPSLAVTPEADVYVQVESALVKASRDTVSFNEQQPTTGTTLALSVDKLLSVGASSMAVRVAR